MKQVLLTTTAFLIPITAFAQTAAPPTVDLTGIATAIIAGIFGVLGVVIPLMIQSHMKDQAAGVAVSNAVKNSLGAMQQAATSAVKVYAPKVTIPGVSPQMASGVQYVLDNAGDEAARLGITQDKIAQKIAAQVGLAGIATNLAVASSSSPSVPDPMGPTAKATPTA